MEIPNRDEDLDLHLRIDNDFVYHPPRSKEQEEVFTQLRAALRTVAHEIVDLVPPGRERSLALTKLEEAMFWANAGVAR